MAKEQKQGIDEVLEPLLDVTKQTAGLNEEPEEGEESLGDACDTEIICSDEDRVPYVIPRNVLSSDKHQLVIVNGKAFQIEVGKQVTIPRSVAEVLDNALSQRLAIQEESESLAKA